jgi:hypothetical protein
VDDENWRRGVGIIRRHALRLNRGRGLYRSFRQGVPAKSKVANVKAIAACFIYETSLGHENEKPRHIVANADRGSRQLAERASARPQLDLAVKPLTICDVPKGKKPRPAPRDRGFRDPAPGLTRATDPWLPPQTHSCLWCSKEEAPTGECEPDDRGFRGPAFSSVKGEASGLTSPAEGRLGPPNLVAV